MKREEVLLRLREAWPALSALGVRSLLLFGSVARGEAREESDVDLAVDLEGNTLALLDLAEEEVEPLKGPALLRAKTA